MVRAKRAIAAVAFAVLFAGFGLWTAVVGYQAARERHQKFFGYRHPPPPTGGDNMKIEW